MNIHQLIDHWWSMGIIVAEKVIAGIVIVGVIAYAGGSAALLIDMDWSTTEAFYELIHRVLAIIIGLELVRMLVSHSISAVLELLAFVIARKMLTPDLASLDVLLGVVAFVSLMAARHFFSEAHFSHDKQDREHGH